MYGQMHHLFIIDISHFILIVVIFRRLTKQSGQNLAHFEYVTKYDEPNGRLVNKDVSNSMFYELFCFFCFFSCICILISKATL